MLLATMLALLLCLSSAAAAPLTLEAGGGALTLSLDASTLAYKLSAAGVDWFDSAGKGGEGGYAFSADGKQATLAKGGMKPIGAPTKGAGSDASGAYTSLSVAFSRSGSKPEWVATFKAFTNRTAIAFEQQWPQAVPNSAGGSVFPALHKAAAHDVGTLEYTGSSCGFMVGAKGEFPGIAGGSSKGYIVLAPRDTSGAGAGVTFAVGPVTEHFANQASNGHDSLNYGMADSFEFVPAGYTIETVLVASLSGHAAGAMSAAERVSVPSGGVNGALFEYGDYVLSRHSKTRARGDHKTETEYLGYSTTAFYFYNLCDCLDVPVCVGEAACNKSNGLPSAHNRQTCVNSPIPSKYLQEAAKPGVCGSYADTLIAVNAALKEQKIPIKHFLLDSWWYGEGWNGGASLWEDVPTCTGNDTSLAPNAYPADTFPKGLKAFHETVGTEKSIWVHNGFWSPTSPYREKYAFAEARGPPQGDGLWNHVFSENKKWGLGTIKQDHIGEQMGATKSGYKNVSVFKSWMTGMGDGAAANDVGVLYCCAPPNIHMNGVTVPAAYAVRASPDYVWGAGGRPLKLPTVQWAIGPDNAFHWSGLGLLPYKDTFISNFTSTQKSGGWTNDTKQWPSFKGYHEMNAPTHALMSLLSMASVTFGDAVGESNKTLLMQLCREDGMLLKADRPATAIDAQFQAMMFNTWPGGKPGGEPGGMVTAACSPTNKMQQFVYDKETKVLKLAGGKSNEGCIDVGGCKKVAGSEVHLYDNSLGACGTVSVCKGTNEQWTIVKDAKSGFDTIQTAMKTDKPMCLSASGVLAECGGSDTLWALPRSPGTTPFTIKTTTHDDQHCLTAPKALENGALESTAAAVEARAEALFPSATSDVSAGYRNAYATSDLLMEQIEAKRALDEQCKGGFGAPQGPLGEIYSTHTTVGDMTWRWVVGVQVASDFNVTAQALGIAAGDGGGYVSYTYSDESMWHGADVKAFAGGLTVHESGTELCVTSPDFDIKTPCFPFQLHAVAPVASNGWALLGETDKFVPVSNQRIASVTAAASGGFILNLKGAAGETVTMGAADVSGKKTPVYAQATIGADGTATLTLK
jgi:hypothetical protein